MKKFSLLLTLILCLSLITGCSATIPLSFDQNRPWRIFSTIQSPCAEEMTYRVEIFSGTTDDVRISDDTSYYKITLKEGKTLVGTENTLTATVETVMAINYRNDIEFADKGLSDVIETKVIFRLDNLSTLYSYRKVNLANREGQDNNSYEIVMDYVEKASTITYYDGSTKNMKLKNSSPVYDNEMMYYLVRSLSTTKVDGLDSFKIVNGYENFLGGKYSSTSLKASTENTVDVRVDKNIFDLVPTQEDAFEKQGENEKEYYLTCYRTQISLASKKSGPPMFAYFSRGAFVSSGTNTTYKVPVAFVNYEYDIDGKTTYTQMCTLTDYSAYGNY